MVAAKCDEDTFVELVERHGLSRAAGIIGVTVRQANRRRNNLEKKLGRSIDVPDENRFPHSRPVIRHPAQIPLEVWDGVVLIGSDAHYWPGPATVAHRAFVKFIKKLKPRAVIMNGDVFDGARISRHPPIGWQHTPSVVDELEACQQRLSEIEKAAPNAEKIWTLGNHDMRFSTRIAQVAPEFAKVHGYELKDHFPYWMPCWRVIINGNVHVKHRYKGGIHAARNNTLNAGESIVTGHLHRLQAMPLSDYTGLRWGIETGTLAEPCGDQFMDYTEDNPKDWQSGFVVLTFRDGQLMPPELAYVFGDRVAFQGKLHEV